MNKLAVLAMVILAALGGAMWYLAGGALNDYLKRQIIEDGQQLTQHHITVGKVDIQMAAGTGIINNIVIYPRPNVANTAPNHPLVHIQNVALTFDTTSLKKAPIVVSQLVMVSSPMKKSDAITSSLNELLSAIKQQRAVVSEKLKQSEQQIEPFFLFQQVSFNNADISLAYDENGGSLSLVTADILIALIESLIAQSQVTEQ